MPPLDPNFSPTAKETLHLAAQQDSPQGVNIPSTWAGIGSWMLARFGIGGLAFAALYMVYQDMKIERERVYQDMNNRNEKILIAFEGATRTQTEFRSALDSANRSQAETKMILETQTRILQRLEERMGSTK